jgi:DNA-binding IclR family transcriptional regulator
MADATAARRAMAVLRCLAAAAEPLPAATIARQVGMPRSSTYHLLAALAEDGFTVHYPDERRWGLGVSAFEIGNAYLRQDPLQRLAQPVLRTLVRRLPADLPAVAHCAVLHGRETLYIATQSTSRAMSIVAEVGVRLPASLTASGRAMLALLPTTQVRALFPDAAAFVDRTGVGPTTPTALARLLAAERRAGFSVEEGMVAQEYSSVAASSVDRTGRPAASIGVTVHEQHLSARATNQLAGAVMRAADTLSHHVGGALRA